MKKVIVVLIALMPTNALRVSLYRMLLGYKIGPRSRIGFGTLLSCKSVSIGADVTIRRFNRFHGPIDLVMGDRSRIASSCTIHSVLQANEARLHMEEGALVGRHHFIDASGGVVLKRNARLAGRYSQFWTHGGQRKDQSIVIGERCYIGSAVRFSQGVRLARNTYVGLGSVVTRSCDEEGVLLLGNPAKVVKRNITARRGLQGD